MKDLIWEIFAWILAIGICAFIGATIFIVVCELVDFAAEWECFNNKTPAACEEIRK